MYSCRYWLYIDKFIEIGLQFYTSANRTGNIIRRLSRILFNYDNIIEISIILTILIYTYTLTNLYKFIHLAVCVFIRV